MKLSVPAIVLALATSAVAGEVKITGVHLCCGACVRDVKAALKDVDGVSNTAADRKATTVTFDASTDKAAKAGVEALAKAGFFGKAAHGDKVVAFPASGAKKGAKADKVTVNGVHLCCGGCIRAAEKAVKSVKGVSDVAVDRKAKTVVVSGSDIEAAAAIKALNDAGFHGTVGD